MLPYTFWHGRALCPTASVELIENAESALHSNTWTTPVYIDGSNWEGCNVREDAAQRLLALLATNKSASNLTFQNAALKPEMAQTFGTAMSENQGLRTVTVRNVYKANAEEGEQFSLDPSVFTNQEIECFHLGTVSLSLQTCKNLAKLISDKESRLRTITLSNVRFEAQEGIVAILAAIVVSRTLKSFKLNKIEFCHGDLKRLFLALSLNRSIETLHFEGMNLGVNDSLDVARLLDRNRTIKELSLRKNGIDANACRILVTKGLLKNKTLESLYLSSNPLGDDSCEYLAQFLSEKDQCVLRRLCLSNANIMEQGSDAIAQALRFNKSLRYLSMDCNYVDTFGPLILKTLQHYNTTLVSVLDKPPSPSRRRTNTPSSSSTWKEIDFYLRANKANRRSLSGDEHPDATLPSSLEPSKCTAHLLANAGTQSDVFYYLFRHGGNRFVNSSSPHTEQILPSTENVWKNDIAKHTNQALSGEQPHQRQCYPPSA